VLPALSTSTAEQLLAMRPWWPSSICSAGALPA
jgi:hypothetical protein